MPWVVLVIVVLLLLVLVGARGLGGQARRDRYVSDQAREHMDEEFEKPPNEGDLL